MALIPERSRAYRRVRWPALHGDAVAVRITRLSARLAGPLAVLLLAGTLLAVAMWAGSGVAHAERHATTQRAQWDVGKLDSGLSEACRRGQFNQIADHHRHIAYRGEVGAGTTGIAKKGWNLRDPGARADPMATYHFADDGLSTCRVYVARPKTPQL